MGERWKPKYGDTFWYVSELVEVAGTTWEDDGIDPVFYESGNCFRTEEEAEDAAEKVKALLLSLHQQPKKPKKKKPELPKGIPLPDWFQVGAYFWRDGMGYFEIVYPTGYMIAKPVFTEQADEPLIPRPKSGIAIIKERVAELIQEGKIKKARLRWWTASEAIGKVVADGESCRYLITAADDLTVTMGTTRIKKQTLINRYRQPNGSPCGVLSHE